MVSMRMESSVDLVLWAETRVGADDQARVWKLQCREGQSVQCRGSVLRYMGHWESDREI